MKKYILIILLSWFSLSLLGENNPLESVIPPSPQSEAFKMLSDVNVNYQTGAASISIPLYNINHWGFQLPLSLKYNHQGFKKGYTYDVFGVGWGLSVNSSISRKVNYLADEIVDFEVEDPFSTACNSGYSCLEDKNYAHDEFTAVLPDGSSFKFYIEKVGSTINYYVADKRPVSIDYTIFNDVLTEFVVIDESGVKYTFDHTNEYEISSSDRIKTAWHLTEIELPHNGELIKFFYDKDITNTNSAQDFITSFVYSESVSCNYSSAPDAVQSGGYKYTMSQLTGISYSDIDIEFNYNCSLQDCEHNYVKSIKIKEDDTTIREIKLYSTDVQQSGTDLYSIMRLDSVASVDPLGQIDRQTYKCVYGAKTNFSTQTTDHWGYLNAATSPSNYGIADGNIAQFEFYLPDSLEPAEYEDFFVERVGNNFKYKLGDYNREPGGNHMMLSSVYNPMGGRTDFFFENHKYTESEGDDSRVNAGGFRIKQVKHYDDNNELVENKVYKYGKLESDGSGGYQHTGVGQVVLEPTVETYSCMRHDGYSVNFKDTVVSNGAFCRILDEDVFNCQFSPLFFRGLLNGRPPVIYDMVTVYYGGDEAPDSGEDDTRNGKTVYYYDIYDQDLDGNKSFFEPSTVLEGGSYYSPKPYRYNILSKQEDYRFESNVYELVKKVENTWGFENTSYFQSYKNVIDVPDCIFLSNQSTIPITDYFVDIYMGQEMPLLDERKTVEYLGTDSVVFEEEFAQNGFGQLISHTINQSDGTSKIIKTKFPIDVNTGVYANMANDSVHQINNPIEQLTYEGTKVTGGSLTTYKLEDGNYVADKTYMVEATSPISSFVTFNGTTKDSHYNSSPEIEYVDYNSDGKIVKAYTKAGTYHYFLWGYGGQFPVAKIVSSNSRINVSSLQTSINGISFSESDTYTQVESHKNSIKTALSTILSNTSNMVTYYTYKPMFGMTSQTGVTGITTYYEYDNFGRLINTRNDDKDLVNSYEYHYKN